MSKSYTGDQIVAKVRQASSLIEQGKPLRDVWASVQISRQTYNRWKGICDSIQSEFESQTKEAAKEIDSFKEKNRQLTAKLKKVQGQVRDYERQLEAADQRLSTLSGLQDQLTEANNARISSDKIVEDLRAQLSKTEKQLRERIADSDDLKRRYEQSQERSRKATEQLEQGEVEPATPSESKKDSAREDDGNSLKRSNWQNRDSFSEGISSDGEQTAHITTQRASFAKPQTKRQTQVRRPIDSRQWISKTETRLIRYLLSRKPDSDMDADSESTLWLWALPCRISSLFRWVFTKRAYT